MPSTYPASVNRTLPPVYSTLVAADGSFIQYRVEDFDSGYYQLSELDAMIRQEVQDYVSGASGSGTVAVEQVDTIEGNQDQVMVALRFANSHVYEDYAAQVDRQPCSLFYGTVGEAIEAGYELEGVLRDANKGEMKLPSAASTIVEVLIGSGAGASLQPARASIHAPIATSALFLLLI